MFSFVIALTILFHLILFSGAPLLGKALAALLLTGLLPGVLLIEWLFGQIALRWWERLLYSVGVSYAIIVCVMLWVSYLPGPLTRWHTLAAFDLLILFELVLLGKRGHFFFPTGLAQRFERKLRMTGGSGWLLAGVLSLALLGGFFRLMSLGYSEFQGDEARAALRAAAVIQGYEDVLLIHPKGPSEILLPTVIYSLTERLNEQVARLPFALANLSGLFALFVLGWRLFGPMAGWCAAMLLAFDGYFIAFARIVQYQSVVFLMSVLVVLIFYHLVETMPRLGEKKRRRLLPRYLMLAALFTVTGLLSHYEALFALLPASYLLFLLWRRGIRLSELGRGLLMPTVVGGVVLASFYLPFVLHPHFRQTYQYLAGDRIGGQFPYNNLADFFIRTTLYSTTYYVVLMIILTIVALLLIYRRTLVNARFWFMAAGVVAGFWLLVLQPSWFTIGGTDITAGFFMMLLLSVLLVSGSALERTVWLWFGVLLLLMLFFIAKPFTHVYLFFMPWALICGKTMAQGWNALDAHLGRRSALAVGISLYLFGTSLFGGYAYWYFIYNQVEVLRTWEKHHPRGFWTVYEMPDYSKIFGFPLRNGWKVVGVLYEEGVLSRVGLVGSPAGGDGFYDSNEKNWITDWYTRGAEYCPRDSDYFFAADRMKANSEQRRQTLLHDLEEQYQPVGSVLVHERPRLQILQKRNFIKNANGFAINYYEQRFDAEFSSPYFRLRYPTINPTIQHPLTYRLGDHIWLEGYDLDREQVRPGERIQLTLYWRSSETLFESYKVFNHVTDSDGAKYGQRDGLPGCDAQPTTKWEPGELVVDRYEVPILLDAKPGTYSLLTGMYHAEQNTRLEIYDAKGQPIGNAIELTGITVEAEP